MWAADDPRPLRYRVCRGPSEGAAHRAAAGRRTRRHRRDDAASTIGGWRRSRRRTPTCGDWDRLRSHHRPRRRRPPRPRPSALRCLLACSAGASGHYQHRQHHMRIAAAASSARMGLETASHHPPRRHRARTPAAARCAAPRRARRRTRARFREQACHGHVVVRPLPPIARQAAGCAAVPPGRRLRRRLRRRRRDGDAGRGRPTAQQPHARHPRRRRRSCHRPAAPCRRAPALLGVLPGKLHAAAADRQGLHAAAGASGTEAAKARGWLGLSSSSSMSSKRSSKLVAAWKSEGCPEPAGCRRRLEDALPLLPSGQTQ